MVNTGDKKKKSAGRPKGSKSELGVPIKSLKEAVELTKMAYESSKGSIMGFSEMAGYMGLKKGSDTPTIGALKWYGLVEQSDGGWKVSELGQKAIQGDRESARSAFEKVDLFRDLSSKFAEKDVSIGFIIDYIKKNYRKGENEKKIIANRFVEGLDYIKASSGKTFVETKEDKMEKEAIRMPPKRSGHSDNFYTPNIAINPIMPYLNKSWRIWECCSGTGNIVKFLTGGGL